MRLWRLASCALAAAAVCGTFAPVTRADWLAMQVERSSDPAHRAALQQAWALVMRTTPVPVDFGPTPRQR
jgi:hypothetical protein